MSSNPSPNSYIRRVAAAGAGLALLAVPVIALFPAGRDGLAERLPWLLLAAAVLAWGVYQGLRRVMRASAQRAASRLERAHEAALRQAEEKDMALIKARELCETMRHMALHDPLTGLPNHALYLDRLEQAIHTADRVAVPVTVIVMDLNRFKDIVGTHGRHAGDELLRETAQRLQGIMRKTDTVAHLGGDEFAFILPMTEGGKAVAFSKKILGVLAPPFEIAGRALHIDASCGIALAPEHGAAAYTLVERATAAMRAAKADPLAIVVYDEAHDRSLPARLQKINNLRSALEGERLHLAYQPKIDLRTHTLCGAEALVRWHTEENGLIPPSSFIPLTEEIGLIDTLSNWVLKTAITEAGRWVAAGIDISVSVNLSARNLHNKELAGYIGGLLRDSALPPAMLVLEITESAVMEDPAVSMETLSQLHAMGLRLSLDDFGTGYSSLSRLKRLPFDQLKIDASFVRDIVSSSRDAAIVQTIVHLANALGVEVLAEGVETQAQKDRLMALGCKKFQGFLDGAPMPIGQIEAKFLALKPV